MLIRCIVGMMLSGVCTGLVAAADSPQQEPAGVSASDAIAARQASMDMSSITLRSMGEALKSGRDAKSQAYGAAALAKWSRVLPHLFPQGTGKDATAAWTQARSEIWQDRAGFERVATNYAAATSELAALAKANDADGFTRQLVVVDQACKDCHSHYKEGDQGAPTKK